MSPEDVKNIVRLEMRSLAAEIHNIHTGNHDADAAVKAVAQAIYKRFPRTLREECLRIAEGWPHLRNSYRYQLDDVGERIGVKRANDEDDDHYRARLQQRVNDVIAGRVLLP